MAEERLHIAVGVIYDRAGDSVLVARRRPESHQGGYWEFPGGKRAGGEGRREALQRELGEELDITVESAHPLLCFDYDYPDRPVRLDVWVVDAWSGKPRGNEGQDIRWLNAAGLDPAAFPAANRRIIRALALPGPYFITPDLDDYGGKFLSRFEALLQSGLRLARFRSLNLEGVERHRVLGRVGALCAGHGCILLGSGPADRDVAGVRGLHLDSEELMQLHSRPAGEDAWVAASCHGRDELRQAGRLELDFCVLSPVRPTASHPGGPVLGWERFAELAAAATIPVYALGGLKPDDLDIARRHNAHGIAMISALWEATGY
jgi:8-oxo-dGTP diphosphatase